MRAIWKFDLAVERSPVIEMPRGAKVLCVQTQCGRACIWAIVDSTAPKEPRRFEIRGTGHALEEDPGDYTGTFQLRTGSFVGHLFEHV